MIELSALEILNAIEGGDIESIRDDGVITILIDLKPVLIVPEVTVPQVKKSVGNMVSVWAGDIPIAAVQADDEADAEEIAGALADLLSIG